MNKFAKVMISGVVIGGLLSACSTTMAPKTWGNGALGI
jgi:hypothetical protein